MDKREWRMVRYIGGIPLLPKRRTYTLRLTSEDLQFCKGKRCKYALPVADISDVQVVSYLELYKPVERSDRSVIGRGVAGGLLLGPVGAVVGGMSGIGSKQKLTLDQSANKHELVVVVSASDSGVAFKCGLIVPALVLRRRAADGVMSAIQEARVRWARNSRSEAATRLANTERREII